jgi:hypothetical protein
MSNPNGDGWRLDNGNFILINLPLLFVTALLCSYGIVLWLYN